MKHHLQHYLQQKKKLTHARGDPRGSINFLFGFFGPAQMKELCRKDALKRHLQRYNNIFTTGLFDFVPRTFTLPKEYVQFATAFAKAADKEEGTRCETTTKTVHMY
jgi:hypothetical protein